jgi:hypothetical protein
LNAEERDRAVGELIELVAAVDGILQLQAPVDVEYFVAVCGRRLKEDERKRLDAAVLRAYRWQYIASGVKEPRFSALLGSMITADHMQRIGTALAPILQ